MHGYFVDQRLYDEARLIADPFEWERERKRMVAAKIEKQRESRIRSTAATAKVKINKRLAERLVALEGKLAKASGGQEKEREGEGEREREGDEEAKVLKDTRFTRLFQNPDFEVDETSLEFRQLNPSTNPLPPNTRKTVMEKERASSPPSSSESAKEDEQKKQPQMRISTSSYKKAYHNTRGFAPSSVQKRRNRERSFGEQVFSPSAKDRPREKVVGKNGAATGGRGVMGEREVTFFATSGRRGGQQGGGGRARPARERRSASGNVFRREGLGK